MAAVLSWLGGKGSPSLLRYWYVAAIVLLALYVYDLRQSRAVAEAKMQQSRADAAVLRSSLADAAQNLDDVRALQTSVDRLMTQWDDWREADRAQVSGLRQAIQAAASSDTAYGECSRVPLAPSVTDELRSLARP